MNVWVPEIFKIYLENKVLNSPFHSQVVLKAEFSIYIDIKWIQDAPVVHQQHFPKDELCQYRLTPARMPAAC